MNKGELQVEKWNYTYCANIVFGTFTQQDLDHFRKQLDGLNVSQLKKTSLEPTHW